MSLHDWRRSQTFKIAALVVLFHFSTFQNVFSEEFSLQGSTGIYQGEVPVSEAVLPEARETVSDFEENSPLSLPTAEPPWDFELLRQDFASAVPRETPLSFEEIRSLLQHAIEEGIEIAALLFPGGKTVLVSTGSRDEIGASPVTLPLLRRTQFFHLHPDEHSEAGPTALDLEEAGPEVRYVLTQDSVYAYTQEGVLETLSLEAFYACYLEALEEARQREETRTQDELNLLITELDRWNQGNRDSLEPWLSGGTVSPTTGLGPGNVTLLPGDPFLYLLPNASPPTAVTSLSGNRFRLAYNVSQAGSVSGSTLSFDNPSDSEIQTQDLSRFRFLTFGVRGRAHSVRIRFVDFLGNQDTFTLVSVAGNLERFYRIPTSRLASRVRKNRIRRIDFFVNGVNTTAETRTGNLFLRIRGVNLERPPAPEVTSEIPWATNQTSLTLSGTKEAHTAVLVNGVERVPRNAAAAWSSTVDLFLEGENRFDITTRNTLGFVSEPLIVILLRDTLGPAGQVRINAATDTSNSPTVTLDLSADDGSGSGVAQMSFSEDGFTWTATEPFSFTKLFTFSGGDGLKTVYVRFQDAAGNWSFAASDSITLDTTPPEVSFTINNDAPATGTRNVTLQIQGTDAATSVQRMRFSQNQTPWTVWENYSTTKSFTLNLGDGTKTVYVQLRDEAGNVSNPVSDTITLDTAGPTGSVSINNGDSYTLARDVSVTLSAQDAATSVDQIRVSTDEGVTWSPWQAYVTSLGATLSSGDGAKEIRIQASDILGNVGTFADTITLDTTAPTGSLSINNGALYTNSTVLSLAVSGSDSGTGVEEMHFSDSGGLTGSPWEAFRANPSFTLSSSGEGLKEILGELRDGAGFISEVFSDTVTLDTTLPTVTVLINGGDLSTNSRTVTLTLDALDSLSGVSQVRFSENGTDWGGWETYASSETYTLSAGDGGRTLYVQVRDRANNLSLAATDDITLDTTQPTGSVSINNGAAYTTSTEAVLTLTAQDAASGVDQIRVSPDNGNTWEAWRNFVSSLNVTLPTGEGSKTVLYEILDNAGNVRRISDSITLDTAEPAVTVFINSGALYTNSSPVTLALTASDATAGVSEMRFSDDGVNWTDWETYQNSKSYTLPAGDGLKRVYVQVRDRAGLISQTAQDTITQDLTPPSGTIAIENGAPATADREVSLSLTASDAASGLENRMRFSFDQSNWFDPEPLAASKTVKLPRWDGTKTVYYELQDQAGNLVVYSDTIDLETGGPQVFVTSPAVVRSTSYTLRWVADGAARSRQETLNQGNGDYDFVISETDPHGNTTTVNFRVTLDTGLSVSPRTGLFKIDLDSAIEGASTITSLMKEMSRKFLSMAQDVYDFLVFVPTFSTAGILEAAAGTASWGISARNPIQGIGRNLFDTRPQYGSSIPDGALDHTVYFFSDFSNPNISLTNFNLTVFNWLFLHETAHYWLQRLTQQGDYANNPLGIVNGDPHWSPFFEAGLSPMRGFDWTDNGDGTFTVHHGNRDFWNRHTGQVADYNDFDLYSMGLLSPEEVRPSYVIDNPRLPDGRSLIVEEGQTYALNSDGTREVIQLRAGDRVSGTRRTVTIQDILDIEGLRSPAPPYDQKDFSLAFVVVNDPDNLDRSDWEGTVAKLNTFAGQAQGVWEEGASRRSGIDFIPASISSTLAPEVEFLSPASTTNANYTLVYRLDGIEKRESAVLQNSKTTFVREFTGTNNHRRVASFTVALNSGASSSSFSRNSSSSESSADADFMEDHRHGHRPSAPVRPSVAPVLRHSFTVLPTAIRTPLIWNALETREKREGRRERERKRRSDRR